MYIPSWKNRPTGHGDLQKLPRGPNRTFRVSEAIVEIRAYAEDVLLTSEIEIEIKEFPDRFLVRRHKGVIQFSVVYLDPKRFWTWKTRR